MNIVPHANVVDGKICGIFKKPRWCRDRFKVLVACAVVFSVTIAIALVIDLSLRSHTKYIEVVTDDGQCTRLVKDLFKSTKANAIDGAIAGMLCLAVTRPDHVSLARYVTICHVCQKTELAIPPLGFKGTLSLVTDWRWNHMQLFLTRSISIKRC